jgi:hypothetical protein
MRLFVQIAKSDGVGQKSVELFRHLQTDRFLQLKRQLVANGSVALEFTCVLMKTGLCIDGFGIPGILLFCYCHRISFYVATWLSLLDCGVQFAHC